MRTRLPPELLSRIVVPVVGQWTQMSTSTRVGVCILVVVAALIVAVWPPETGRDEQVSVQRQSASDGPSQSAIAPGGLVEERARARLSPCPAPGPSVSASSPLVGVTLDCLTGPPTVDIARAGAGRPMLINYWAFWCAPCREELPIIAEYALRAGQRVQVLTVQGVDGAQRPDLSLKLLTDIAVHLPTALDTQGRLAAAVGIPRVYPTSVLIRPDGTVAALLPRVFRSSDEIASAVEQYLAVTT